MVFCRKKSKIWHNISKKRIYDPTEIQHYNGSDGVLPKGIRKILEKFELY